MRTYFASSLSMKYPAICAVMVVLRWKHDLSKVERLQLCEEERLKLPKFHSCLPLLDRTCLFTITSPHGPLRCCCLA